MRTRVFLLTPLACACAAAFAQSLPSGGTVVQGAGRIGVNGNAMVIDQATNRMVTDWQSFSIGAGNSVRFNQPSSSSVALNRVVGGDPSKILGSLSANGHVYLQNPNGVLFAPGAQVDVGSLVATTLNADVGEFMAGRLRLSGSSGAAVVNEGQITSAAGGHVVLAGAQVENHGAITTPGGTSALVAGAAVNVDATGAGLLTISVPVAAIGASLVNRGAITADGGAVRLQAAAEDAARRTVMQIDGVVRARSIEQRDGQILLSGGSSGVVAVGGTLDASGGSAARGGTVEVFGDRVALSGSARVDASGTQGGTVLLGGNWQGQGPAPNAQATYVASGSLVDASATGAGNGGTVVVWSDGRTRFDGQINARGGASGGDGGRVEVSGKQTLEFTGGVDTSAAAGRAGSLLLDPVDLVIGATADVNGDGTNGDDITAAGVLYADAGGTSQITAAGVASLLTSTNVLLQARNSLTVSSAIDVAGGGAATTLTLNSPFITLNAAVSLGNASLVADTQSGFSDSIRVNAALSSLNSVALTSSDIGINAVVTASQVSLRSSTSGGSATEGVNGGIVAAQVATLRQNGAALDLSLTSANNRIGSLTLNGGNADVRVDNPAGTPLSIQGTVSGDLTLIASGGLAQSGALVVSADTQLTALGSNAATLTNAANQFSGPLNFSAGGDFSLIAQGPQLQISGAAAGSVLVNVLGGTLALGTAGITTTGALIDLSSAGFISTAGGTLSTGAGGRFFIRSSDFSQDALGSIGFGSGANAINHMVFGGWVGATPASGNVYETNATGALTTGSDIGAVTKVYDATLDFSYTQSGTAATGTITTAPGGTLTLAGYTLNSVGTFADKNVGTDKAYSVSATNSTIATGSGGEQYYGLRFAAFSRPGGTGAAGVSEITPRAVTSTGVTAVGRVYDATTTVALNTGGATLNGVIPSDSVTLDTSGATGTMADKNVGTNKAVTVSSLALTGTDGGNYVVTDASSATATITPRPITATGATAIDRVYDGTTTVAMNTSAASLTGVLGEDFVAIAGATGTMADKNAGSAKPVTISAVALSGTDAGNYVATGVGTPSVNIAQRTLTSTGITGVDRVYDGTTAVAIDTSGVVLSNAVAGDAVALNTAGASGTMADKNVGTNKPVTLAGLALSGADAANYTLVDASAPTVDIAALALTPTGITATNRVVDGGTAVTIDASGASVLGVLPGDSVTLVTSGATGAVATPDPGTKPVLVSGLALSGSDAANYSILAAPVTASGSGLMVRILSVPQAAFEEARYQEYLQGISDAQEPFRRAMAEALAAGFGKENIRKQLTRGLVFETGLAAPAVDRIEPAAKPAECSAGVALACAK